MTDLEEALVRKYGSFDDETSGAPHIGTNNSINNKDERTLANLMERITEALLTQIYKSITELNNSRIRDYDDMCVYLARNPSSIESVSREMKREIEGEALDITYEIFRQMRIRGVKLYDKYGAAKGDYSFTKGHKGW